MQKSNAYVGLLGERIVAVVIVVTTGFFLSKTFGEVSAFASQSAGRGPFFFPRIVLTGLLFAECFLLWTVFNPAGLEEKRKPNWKLAFLVLATGLYCAFIPMLGFLISSALFAFAVPLLLGRRDLIMIAIVSIIYSISLWLLFERVFLIILPDSPFDVGF